MLLLQQASWLQAPPARPHSGGRCYVHAMRAHSATMVSAVGSDVPLWLSDGIAAVRSQNAEVLPLLQDLRARRFFRLYAADLLAGCSYFPMSEVPCELGACEVDPTDEVPEELEARDTAESAFELDAWARWDQPSDFTEYYDLIESAESNTGYDGSEVWKFIHGKIQFQNSVELAGNEWKSDFNRIVSGFHSSVSCNVIGDLAETDPEEALVQYRRRLRDEPDAVANLYFAFMVVLSGISSTRQRLDGCGYLGEGVELLATMKTLTASPLLQHPAVQAAATNLRRHAESPDATPWKLRMRTRDLLRVMNCVQCNLCRLHGKVTVLGLAAALQVLLGFSGRGDECDRPPDPTSLQRVEVAALVTACAKLSEACALVQRMEELDREAA